MPFLQAFWSSGVNLPKVVYWIQLSNASSLSNFDAYELGIASGTKMSLQPR